MNRTQLTQCLIDGGASLDLRDPEGSTALIRAAVVGLENIVELLAISGADLEAKNKRKDSAVILCARMNTDASFLSLEKLCELGAKLDRHGSAGMTALMWSAHWGNVSFVKLLLSSGSLKSINARSHFGQTALFHAVDNNCVDSAIFMLQHAEIDTNLGMRSDPPASVIAVVCRRNNVRAIELIDALIERGANPNTKGPEGYTPIMWTCVNGDKELCRKMLFVGANPLIENTHGMDAVDMAPSVVMRLMLAEAGQVNTHTHTRKLVLYVVVM